MLAPILRYLLYRLMIRVLLEDVVQTMVVMILLLDQVLALLLNISSSICGGRCNDCVEIILLDLLLSLFAAEMICLYSLSLLVAFQEID